MILINSSSFTAGANTAGSTRTYDGTHYGCNWWSQLGSAGGAAGWNTSKIVVNQTASGNLYEGTISSLDSDGFTISWTKTGGPSGFGFSYTCFA